MGNLELFLQKNPELPEIAKIIMKRALPEPLVVILDLMVRHLSLSSFSFLIAQISSTHIFSWLLMADGEKSINSSIWFEEEMLTCENEKVQAVNKDWSIRLKDQLVVRLFCWKILKDQSINHSFSDFSYVEYFKMFSSRHDSNQSRTHEQSMVSR